MKISLCMICGNEEETILRCLDSAKSAFDELCLVRAVGNVAPDKTIELAHFWCIENGKKFRRDFYQNAADFPHVDNFGEARNRAFDLATGDWLLWLDCDDYLDEINCARIREAVSTCTEYTALFCTYDVEKNGAKILRERLIKRGCGRWKGAIHEVCEITSGKSAECPQIVVHHSDHTKKHKSSAERNARILRAVLADVPRNLFYLQAELKMLGDKEGARDAAHAALAMLDESRKEEIYNARLNLSELEPENTEQHLFEAIKFQPHRREAYAYLCQKALIDGRTSDAVSFFRAMDALPLPSPIPWTHQGIWYGWGGNMLRVRVLRACGQVEQAEKEHAEHLKDADYAANMN